MWPCCGGHRTIGLMAKGLMGFRLGPGHLMRGPFDSLPSAATVTGQQLILTYETGKQRHFTFPPQDEAVSGFTALMYPKQIPSAEVLLFTTKGDAETPWIIVIGKDCRSCLRS
jgi:hypothetical protein